FGTLGLTYHRHFIRSHGTLQHSLRVLDAPHISWARDTGHVYEVVAELQTSGLLKIRLGFPDDSCDYLRDLILSWFWDVRPKPAAHTGAHHARSETMSEFSWHTDCSYEDPLPRYFALQALQHDRYGGGTLSAMNVASLIKFLSSETRKALMAPEGDIITPLTTRAEQALEELRAVLVRREVQAHSAMNLRSSDLPKGSILLMDNRRWMHARNEINDPERHLRRRLINDTDPRNTYRHNVYTSVTGGGGGVSKPLFFATDAFENRRHRALFGEFLKKIGIIERGDWVLSTHHGGSLYRSLDLTLEILENAGATVLAAGHQCPPPTVVQILQDFNVNVLAGDSSQIISIVHQISTMSDMKKRIKIGKVIYTAQIYEVLGPVIIYSILGGAEAGPYGASSPFLVDFDPETNCNDFIIDTRMTVIEVFPLSCTAGESGWIAEPLPDGETGVIAQTILSDPQSGVLLWQVILEKMQPSQEISLEIRLLSGQSSGDTVHLQTLLDLLKAYLDVSVSNEHKFKITFVNDVLGFELSETGRKAVSSSLPTWESVVALASADKRVLDRIEYSYPRYVAYLCGLATRSLVLTLSKRFFIGKPIRSLVERVRERLKFDSDDLLRKKNAVVHHVRFFSPVAANSSNGNDYLAFSALFVPPDFKVYVMEFWVNFGTGITTRHAEYCLKHFDELISDSPDVEPHGPRDFEDLQAHIAQLATSERDDLKPVQATDVFIFPNGMNAIYNAAEVIAVNNPDSFVVAFGWIYPETIENLRRGTWKGVIPFKLGNEEELDQLASTLKTNEQIIAIFCELPSNIKFTSPNLHRIRELANEYGLIVVCDETVANFVNVDLLPYVDIITTSLTKMFSGAANVTGGRSVALYQTLRLDSTDR
ncbi:hypothetical protein H9L39_05270, partial [Fusarium oxysporum f. sp. albedinis]